MSQSGIGVADFVVAVNASQQETECQNEQKAISPKRQNHVFPFL